jgi:hypothetical protein
LKTSDFVIARSEATKQSGLSDAKIRMPRPGPYFARIAFAGARPGLRSLWSPPLRDDKLAMTSLLFFNALIDKEMITNAVAQHTSFTIIHRESMFKVDVFIPEMRPFVKEQLNNIAFYF